MSVGPFGNLPGDFKFLPKHSYLDRALINHNGVFVPDTGIFIFSGTIDNIAGSTTGSVSFNVNAPAVRLRRIQTFHSGAAANFNLALENASPNTGSFFDPRAVVTCYNAIPGATDFNGGIDQIEDIIGLTDCVDDSQGRMYLKFMPYSTGLNSFKYLLIMEAAVVYVGTGEVRG